MRKIASLLVLILILAACGGTAQSEGEDTSSGPPAITGQTDERIQAIADLLNYEADQSEDSARRAIRVTYADRVDHHNADGSIHYGVHYIVVVAADAGDAVSLSAAQDVAGRIFQLTTEHVFPTHPKITHMGVQIIESDAWFVGGHEVGGIYFHVASRAALEQVAAHASSGPEQFLAVASENRISGGWLQGLINELQRLRNP